MISLYVENGCGLNPLIASNIKLFMEARLTQNSFTFRNSRQDVTCFEKFTKFLN